MAERLAALRAPLPVDRPRGLAYFRARLAQAPRDARARARGRHRERCRRASSRRRAVAALSFKTDVLWAPARRASTAATRSRRGTAHDLPRLVAGASGCASTPCATSTVLLIPERSPCSEPDARGDPRAVRRASAPSPRSSPSCGARYDGRPATRCASSSTRMAQRGTRGDRRWIAPSPCWPSSPTGARCVPVLLEPAATSADYGDELTTDEWRRVLDEARDARRAAAAPVRRRAAAAPRPRRARAPRRATLGLYTNLVTSALGLSRRARARSSGRRASTTCRSASRPTSPPISDRIAGTPSFATQDRGLPAS